MPIVVAPSALAPPAGSPTLADLERELARRTGPYYEVVIGTGSVAALVALRDASVVEQGGLEGLWLLRRGWMADGTAAPGIDPRDRQRLVAIHDALAGTLTVERPYAVPPVAGELVECSVLEPAGELRVAVRRGLDRCFFEDRVVLPASSAAAERDLTAARSWLTRPTQLRGVSSLAAGSTAAPTAAAWWDWFTAGGHLSLGASPDPYPDALYVTALRPHSSWVNGADSTTGPTTDADVLSVALEYAVVAAHHYAWEASPTRLGGTAGRGNYPTKAEVAAGWKLQIRAHVRPPPDRVQLGAPWPSWAGVGE